MFNLIFGEKDPWNEYHSNCFFRRQVCPCMEIRNGALQIILFRFLFLFVFSAGALSMFAQSPQRIISLAPSLTKNLYLLNAENLLVGCTNYCQLQSGTEAEIVASAVQVNYEKAVVLKPDLIITTDLTKARTIDTFKKLGMEVLVFKNPTSFAEICEQFILLGEKIGRKEAAEGIIRDAKQRMQATRQKIPANTPGQKIFMQIGAKPLFVVVPGTFMNDYITFSETENIFADLKMGSVNRETILIRNPDIIVVVLMGTMNTEEKKRWEGFEDLSAVKRGQVYTMDADNACSPTPLSFVEALEELIELIY